MAGGPVWRKGEASQAYDFRRGAAGRRVGRHGLARPQRQLQGERGPASAGAPGDQGAGLPSQQPGAGAAAPALPSGRPLPAAHLERLSRRADRRLRGDRGEPRLRDHAGAEPQRPADRDPSRPRAAHAPGRRPDPGAELRAAPDLPARHRSGRAAGDRRPAERRRPLRSGHLRQPRGHGRGDAPPDRARSPAAVCSWSASPRS